MTKDKGRVKGKLFSYLTLTLTLRVCLPLVGPMHTYLIIIIIDTNTNDVVPTSRH